MKKNYTYPSLELVVLEIEDILTYSNNDATGDAGELGPAD